MKRIHLWVTAIVAVSIISLAACKKDPKAAAATPVLMQPDPTKVYMPHKIKGSNFTTTYTYSGENADILYWVTKSYNFGDTVYSIFYDDLYQPQHFATSLNGVLISQTQYSLNANGEVIRGDVYNVKVDGYDDWYGDLYGLATLKSYYTLTYNSSGQLSQVSYYHANGQKDYDEFFEYTPDGNIIGTHSAGNSNLEYDNFNGIGKSVKNAHLFYIEGRDPLLFYTRNNPTKLNQTFRSYKYNVDKYPVEMSVMQPGGTRIFKIEYRLK